MRISCIIPTRNRCQMVTEALTSVMAQRMPVSECIVVNDGSTDNTEATIIKRFPRLRIVRLNGQGAGAARNAGAKAASGDILMFLDSDDLWLPTHVEALVDVLATGVDLAYGTTETRDHIHGGRFLIPQNGMGVEGDCFSALTRWCFLVPSAVAVTRQAFNAVKGFGTEPFGEDWAFFLRLAARFHFSFAGATPITIRRLHQNSRCALADTASIRSTIQAVINVLRQEFRAAAEDIDRLRSMQAWVAHQEKGWDTVQDWYLAMQQECIS